jgi:hypothetical protein
MALLDDRAALAKAALVALLALAGCGKTPLVPEPTPVDTALAQYVLDEEPGDVAHRTRIDFEGKVAIIGYDVQPEGVVGPGQKLKLTLYWKSEAPLGQGWSLFTHMTVPGGARVPGNFDDIGPLRARSSQDQPQALPPSQWQPGKIYVDVQELEIPREIRAPEVSVLVGVWRDVKEPVDGGPERHIGMRLDPISGPSDNERRAIIVNVNTGVVPAPAAEPRAAAKKS